ncbi:MAG: hypothetical protein WBL61_04585 [Bryobacteraceae bacterium]
MDAKSKEFGQVEDVIQRVDSGLFAFEIPGLNSGVYYVHARARKAGFVYEAWMNVDVDSAGRSGIESRPVLPVDIHGHVELEGVAGAKLSRLRLDLDNSSLQGAHVTFFGPVSTACAPRLGSDARLN